MGWKARLGIIIAMLAMVLAVSVPAAAQDVWLEVNPADCIGNGVDDDVNGVVDDGTWLCPVDLGFLGDFQQDFDEEDFDEEDFFHELDLDEEDLLEAFLLSEFDCDDLDDDDCDDDDDDDCDDDDDDDCDDDDDDEFEELFD